jgi:hypothetical protein
MKNNYGLDLNWLIIINNQNGKRQLKKQAINEYL